MGKGPQDYIEVKDRIQMFLDQYPEGSLQGSWEHVEIAGEHLIVYTARAYRSIADDRPGVGTASEPFPGKTNFTRGSELANAETSAWGRAIVALGIAAHKGVASAQDVRKAQLENKDFKQLPPAGVSSTSGRTTDETPAVSLAASDRRKVLGMATERAVLDRELMLMMCKAAEKPSPNITDEAEAADWVAKALPRFPKARLDALVGLIEVGRVVEA
jgi:hypothetical protein